MTKKEYYDFREDDNTRQVSLLLLLRSVLRNWVLIIAVGVLFGALLGGYKIFSIHRSKDSMISDYEAYQAKASAYKQSQEDYRDTVAELQRTIATRKEYYSNSALMQVNPYSVPTCTVNLNISSTAERPLTDANVNTIRASISNEILTGETIRNAAEKTGMSTENLRDMTTAQTPSGNSIIRVTVRAESEELATQIMEYILEGVESKHKMIAANVGEFVCTPYNLSTSTIPDSTIATAQDKFTDSLSKLETSAYTAQNQSSQLARPEPVPQYSKKYMLMNGIKMGLVGMIGGIIVAICALIALAVARGKLFTKDEIDGEYGLINLAEFSGSDIAKEEGKLDYILAQLANSAGKDKSLAIVGTAGQEIRNKLAELLGDKAKETGDGFTFTSVGSILQDAKALRSIGKLDGVVLVEEIGKSEYMQVRREIAILAESGCKILGTVYF